MLGGGACLLVLLTLLGIPTWASVMRHRAVQPVTRETLALQLPPAPKETAQPAVATWKTVEVQPGQTMSEIFQAQGLSGTDLAKVMASGKDTGALKALHPGDEVAFLTNASGKLQGFRYDPDSSTRVTLSRQADGNLLAQVATLPIERRMHFAHGVVQGSLFAAGESAGLSETMVLKLADVFKYDIDFIKDLKKGDRFTVVYDDIYRNGKYSGAGNIIAAEFVNNGRRYTAYRFKQNDGEIAYYSEDGRPLRKGLLRTPVSFTRLSSTFGMRKDPVLGFTRLHKGVDYAAPIGTPIHAAGDGVIMRRGWVHGFGNFIA
ncbi:MAG: OapA family protein, partial [Rhodanobacteraceae bacterium]